jgi:type IV pilus assembly protein PilO
MTVGGDFIPGDGGFEEAPSYPTVFGVQLTPVVSGVLVALLGLAGAAYLLINVVQPTWQQTQELERTAAEKRSQLINQEETQRQIEEARQQLAEAEKLKADVLTLFASEESLDTLLLDLNERVQSVNAGITDADRRATLSKFESTTPDPEVIQDSSLGAAANGVLQRQVYNVEMQGNFAQTQSIIRNIERLQPLLLVQDFNSEVQASTRILRLDAQGRPVSNQPVPRLTTSFKLIALMPAPTAPPAAPAPGAPAEGQSPPPAQ